MAGDGTDDAQEASGGRTPAAPSAAIVLGSHRLANPVILAPMSGVSDLPFRQAAATLGAGLVVSEMVAGRELATARPDVVRKAAGGDLALHVIQLVGCEARWMAEGARIAEASGADIIDINMGCPAREVTGRLSGSALMREPEHALGLIEAVVGAVKVPITLKMRLGWDHHSLNAPEIARRAETAGIRLVTVHGRTRCQFFKGSADWRRVAAVKQAVAVPVVVNGDILGPVEARRALDQSGADAVMVGRGAYGAPWMPGRIATALALGRDPGNPDLSEQNRIAVTHVTAMLEHYGARLGLRNARKHVSWYLETSGRPPHEVKAWRRRLCTEEDAGRLLAGLEEFYTQAMEMAA
ncbi:MAG: tRNA dihydrouridine synthase DusB [Hyphomicrobiaceae bacterium]|nr:tRNA dihydrouridine synthase DusB [Hyphomicrobiaceae bacterium]